MFSNFFMYGYKWEAVLACKFNAFPSKYSVCTHIKISRKWKEKIEIKALVYFPGNLIISLFKCDTYMTFYMHIVLTWILVIVIFASISKIYQEKLPLISFTTMIANIYSKVVNLVWMIKTYRNKKIKIHITTTHQLQ